LGVSLSLRSGPRWAPAATRRLKPPAGPAI